MIIIKKNKVLSVVIMFLLITAFVACSSDKETQTTQPEAPEVVEPIEPEEPVAPVEPEEPVIEEQPMVMTLDEYPGLEFTANILEKNIIAPGQHFNVHYTITNNGDEIVAFVQGSGSATVPQALKVVSSDIQLVPAASELGPMTMDFRVDSLEPGESLEFVRNFIAVVPTEDFVQKAMDYMVETEEYIGEQNLDKIEEVMPGLQAVEAGEYKVDASFEYSIVESTENLVGADAPTGYAQADLTVKIGA